MKKTINQSHIEGYFYELPDRDALKKRVSGENSKNPGTEFISGTIHIATDEDCTNIVPVHFSYVTAKTAKGEVNQTFTILNNIVEGNLKSVMEVGKDSASKIRIDSAIGLNDFFVDRNGTEEHIAAKRNEGGFVHAIDVLNEDENLRNTFKTDMIITKVRTVEADEERNLPEKAIVSGYIFDFRNAILPVEFSAINPNAIAYFEGLEASASKPVFTCVWGRQVSQVITKEYRQESAFGDDNVRIVKNTSRDWVITGAAKDTYEWDDEGFITVEEFNKCLGDREIYLATLKKRNDDYKASRNANATATSNNGGFKF